MMSTWLLTPILPSPSDTSDQEAVDDDPGVADPAAQEEVQDPPGDEAEDTKVKKSRKRYQLPTSEIEDRVLDHIAQHPGVYERTHQNYKFNKTAYWEELAKVINHPEVTADVLKGWWE